MTLETLENRLEFGENRIFVSRAKHEQFGERPRRYPDPRRRDRSLLGRREK